MHLLSESHERGNRRGVRTNSVIYISRLNFFLTALGRQFASFHHYVIRNWVPIKRMWCVSHMKALTYGCNTNNRVESAHRWLKQFFGHR